MAKYHDVIGHVNSVEIRPGVWEEAATEREYYGDVMRNTHRWQTGDTVNDNLTLNNLISVVADPFAYENLHTMRYIKWNGTYWKINNIEIQRPRIIITIGGVYNGPKAGS